MRNLAALGLGLVLAFVVTEMLLRTIGNRPWTTASTAIEPTWHDADPELGWWLRPGHWRYGPYAQGGRPVEVTIGSDRTRRTREDGGAGEDRPEVLLLGCSFTFGWAVSDDETWAWRLQALRPDLDVRNRGTGAYSTFQSLLLLERVLARGEHPTRVLFGYITDQATRNVGEPHWLKLLNAFSREESVALPYCTLDAQHRLVRHPAEAYPAWPLHRWSAAVALLEWRWTSRSAPSRLAQEDEVTRVLVAEMADLCRAHGIRFSVVVLRIHPSRQGAMVPFARERGIDVVECEDRLRPGDSVPGEFAHPSARAHAAYAACVADALAGER
jgi:hypothetical protein